MKLLFLTAYELEEVAEKIMSNESKELIVCETGFSEEQDTDVIRVKMNESSEDIPVTGFLSRLNQYFGVDIQEYDVYEVGDFGEGFAFAIK